MIDENLPKKRFVAQRSKHADQVLRAQLDMPRQSVPKTDKERVIWFGLYFNDIPMHTSVLWKRVYLCGRRFLAAQPPVFQKLLFMYLRPFVDQIQGSLRE